MSDSPPLQFDDNRTADKTYFIFDAKEHEGNRQVTTPDRLLQQFSFCCPFGGIPHVQAKVYVFLLTGYKFVSIPNFGWVLAG